MKEGVSESVGPSITAVPAVWRHAVDEASPSVTVADKVTWLPGITTRP